MSEISVEIGNLIRFFRKNQKMTQGDLASAIHKSKATLSKYESGEISVDIDTLYELADALHIHVEQLLYNKESEVVVSDKAISPAFFKGSNRFYSYYYDGRVGQVSKSVLDIFSAIGPNKYKVSLYMNYTDYDHYQQAENVYTGYIEHFDALSLIELTHLNTPTEKASIQILASFLDAETKWGLWNGISSRPMMPVAVKMLFSKKPQKENAELVQLLKLSKEDIQRVKLYNMFSVI